MSSMTSPPSSRFWLESTSPQLQVYFTQKKNIEIENVNVFYLLTFTMSFQTFMTFFCRKANFCSTGHFQYNEDACGL